MTTDRNKNRPGYKETKVGWIPEEWIHSPIGEIATRFSAGVSVNSENREAEENEYGILKTSCVSNGSFRPKENKLVKPDEQSRLSTPVEKDSVIISRMNTPKLVGANAFIPKNYSNLFLPDRLWQTQVASPERDYPKWFGYIMGAPRTRYEISARATGTSGSMKNVTKEEVRAIHIPRPSCPEQEAIAEVLGCWDEGLETIEKLIDEKKLRKKGLMQRLLTGEKRLPGFSKDWKEVRLGDVFKERKETRHNHLPLLAITGNRGIIPAEEVNKKDSSNSDKSKYKRICPGDLGYNTMRMWQGVSAISPLEGIVSPAYTICIPGKELDAKFIGYLFKTTPVIFRFWRYSQGLVDDTLNLKFPNFSKIHISIPSLDEQKAIAEVLETADEEIRLLEAERDALSKQKKGLMQKLLTGEIRMPEFRAAC